MFGKYTYQIVMLGKKIRMGKGRIKVFELLLFNFRLSFLVRLGLELRTLCLESRHSGLFFAQVVLAMESHKLFAQDWPQTTILHISAPQVARIIGTPASGLVLELL
jgi:hypothetical protein